jgi:hypothetical protein
MRRMIAAIGAATMGLGLALPMAGPAHAQSAADTLAQFGMLGRWSRDCGTPPMGINPYVVFERVQGGTGAQYRWDSGTGGSIRRSIDNVRALSANTIAMRVTTLPGAPEPMSANLVLLREPNRYRTISSVGGDGKVHIRDGKVASNGSESPWNDRCPD